MRQAWIVTLVGAVLIAGCRSRCCPRGADSSPDVIVAEPVASPRVESTEAHDLLVAADQVFRTRKYADARAKYEEALAAGEKAGDRRVIVESLAQIARMWSLEREMADRLDKGRPFLERAGKEGSIAEPWGWTRYLGVRGIFEREDGDKSKAETTFTEMYTYAMKHGLHKRAIDAAHHVAIVASAEDQVAWGKKGIAAAEAMDDIGWQAVLWNNLGATYEDLKRYEDAVAAYRKAREFHHRGTDEMRKMISDWAVGHALRLKGDLDEADVWLRKTLTWAEQIHKTEPKRAAEWIGYCLEELGDIAIARDQHADALKIFTVARERYVEGGLESHWPERLKKLDAKIAEIKQRR